MRIRPTYCAFKDVFFGSNPIWFASGEVEIEGHAQDFIQCYPTTPVAGSVSVRPRDGDVQVLE